MHPAAFRWLPDEPLVPCLSARGRRPNLMVLAYGAPCAVVPERVTRVCAHPITTSVLPGRLQLPADRRGTVVLQNVSSMSRSQQIVLNDWIDEGRGSPQIVSITNASLWPLVLN